MVDFALPTKRPKVGEHEDELLFNYSKSLEKYSREFPSQSAYLFLRRVSKDPKAPQCTTKQPFLRMLFETCKEFMMNELEIAMWAIVIDSTVWHVNKKIDPQIMLFTGFSAKHYMNEDMNAYNRHLGRKYPDFSLKYSSWLGCNMQLIKVTPKKLNAKYQALSVPLTFDGGNIDYNYYVDEILQVAPTNGEKEFKREENTFKDEEENDDDIKLPGLMTLDSVLDIAGEGYNQFPTLGRGLSVYEQPGDCLNLEPIGRNE